MPQPGEDLRGYVIERTLGRGGSATVYLARRPQDSRPVALKVLDPRHRDSEARHRLERAFVLTGQLDHPHIVTEYELGPHWIAMQYVDGGNIATLTATADRLIALAQIADALDHAHRMGIVHCDVKPANILVHQDFSAGGAVLIDFAVAHVPAEDMAARLARAGGVRLSLDPARRLTRRPPAAPPTVQASLPYAAPEMLLGRMPSASTDQYSLACTAVELLTGAPPFTASTAAGLIDAHLEQPPPRFSQRMAGLPRGIDAVLTTALMKEPDARHESCAEFVDLLQRVLN